MPTTANLQRLAALRGTLTRLAGVQRGELIRAEDWNSVVSALLELAQAVLAEDDAAVLPPHEHKDQVALDWLETGLRSVIERGPLGDPVAVDRVQRLERQVAALGTRVSTVDDGVGGVRTRLAEVVTRDLVRENDVSTMRRTLDGSVDSRQDVLALRRSLDTVTEQVKAANDAAARLLVNGQPADLDNLASRLADVETLRDALRQGNGELLSAAALETRFTQLTNTLVTESELDAAISGHHALLDDGQLASLKGGLQADVARQVADSVSLAKGELDASITSRLSDVDAAAARAVSDALPALQKAALESAGAMVTEAIGRSQADTAALLDKQFAESAAAQGKVLDARLADVVSSVKGAVAQELALQLPAQVSPLAGQLADSAKTIALLNGQLDQFAKTLALQSKRLDASELALKSAQSVMTGLQETTTKILADQQKFVLATGAGSIGGTIAATGVTPGIAAAGGTPGIAATGGTVMSPFLPGGGALGHLGGPGGIGGFVQP